MNRLHNVICASGWWNRSVERDLLPWALQGVSLGDEVLELGPGFGATSGVLARRCDKLTVLELDDGYCRRLHARLGDKVAVTQGDATRGARADYASLAHTELGFAPRRCLTMRG